MEWYEQGQSKELIEAVKIDDKKEMKVYKLGESASIAGSEWLTAYIDMDQDDEFVWPTLIRFDKVMRFDDKAVGVLVIMLDEHTTVDNCLDWLEATAKLMHGKAIERKQFVKKMENQD